MTALTRLQALVAKHYEGGEFSYVHELEDARDVPDGLFAFLIDEAHDAAGELNSFRDMVEIAANQLRSLRNALEDEPTNVKV